MIHYVNMSTRNMCRSITTCVTIAVVSCLTRGDKLSFFFLPPDIDLFKREVKLSELMH